MSLVTRKPTFWFSTRPDKNRAVQSQKMARGLKFGLRKQRDYTIHVAKTNALISFAVTAKLICVFVFAYAKCWFSYDAAQMSMSSENLVFAYAKNKGTDQLRGIRNFKPLVIFCGCIAPFVSDLVGNPEERFSYEYDAAQFCPFFPMLS